MPAPSSQNAPPTLVFETLGHAIRTEWGLDPDFLTVNHGSFGATPRSVLASQRGWQDRMERQPSRFMRHRLFAQPSAMPPRRSDHS